MRWNNKVKERDGHICQICGEPGTDAHHILCAGYFKDQYYKLDNGITLCRKCHVLAHRGKFGASNKGKYTPEKAAQELMNRASGRPGTKDIIMRLIESDLMAVEAARAEGRI